MNKVERFKEFCSQPIKDYDMGGREQYIKKSNMLNKMNDQELEECFDWMEKRKNKCEAKS